MAGKGGKKEDITRTTRVWMNMLGEHVRSGKGGIEQKEGSVKKVACDENNEVKSRSEVAM